MTDTTSRTRPLRVVVAGATGFVGRALCERLAETHEVVGLTRSRKLPDGGRPGEVGLRFRSCDLFSLLDTERALEGADVAFYLIHSMLPSARLTQASFGDLDLILADNFARAAEAKGVKQIIYLGGIIPEHGELSPHLASRLEVEKTFQAYRTPMTALRASIVIGPHGSSFRIVEGLVRRLPALITPGWSNNPTQPIALDDVVALLAFCVGRPEVADRAFDVAGPDVVTYRFLLEETARQLGLRRWIVVTRLIPPALSKLWVSVISGTPRALVSPLVESLRHPMVASDRTLNRLAGLAGTPIHDAIASALGAPAKKSGPSKLAHPLRWVREASDVRSVQRLPLPAHWRASDVVHEYARWLPRFMFPFIRVDVQPDGRFLFRARLFPIPLLELTHSGPRSTEDRELLYITGGLLAASPAPIEEVKRGLPTDPTRRGRFEFREVLGGRFLLAAIHDFAPRLPWFLYSASQALVHKWVMRSFARHLRTRRGAPERSALTTLPPPQPVVPIRVEPQV